MQFGKLVIDGKPKIPHCPNICKNYQENRRKTFLNDRGTRTTLKHGVNAGALVEYAVPAAIATSTNWDILCSTWIAMVPELSLYFSYLIFLHRLNKCKMTKDPLSATTSYIKIIWYVCLMVSNATFNKISAISWRSVLSMEETEKNIDLSHNVVHLALTEIRTHNISGDMYW